MRYSLTSELNTPSDRVFAWHAHPAAIKRLIPPWENVRILETAPEVSAGSQTRLVLNCGPISIEWLAEHVRIEPGHGFTDRQLQGPFSRWVHEHSFEESASGGCKMSDTIDFDPPGGGISEFIAGGTFLRRIDRAFRWRHRIIASDLQDLSDYGRSGCLNVAVTGSTGLIGRTLCPYLEAAGHRVRSLVRKWTHPATDEYLWSPEKGEIDPVALDGADAVVHLAGESIAAGRWNTRRKRSILESRTEGTSLLARTLAAMDHPPRVMICASAAGFYGDRGDQLLDENSPGGTGFLAEVCSRWEDACKPARDAGIRVVNLRTGLVLTPAGGALRLMLPSFRLGLGGPLGHGGQYFGWISTDDLIRAILHIVVCNDLAGPVIAAAPEAVTSARFSRALAALLRRPAFMRVPSAFLRAALGEMADELLLSSQRVTPSSLLRSGFRFRFPDLGAALAHLTGLSGETGLID